MLRKLGLSVIMLSFCFLPAVAVIVNEPGPPVRSQPKNAVEASAATNSSAPASANSVSESSSGLSGDISKLNSLAMSMLKAAEKRDEAGMQPYFRKMIEMGIDSFYQPQIVAKKTPQCPPVKMELNGRNLSGSLCAKTGYVYNGKSYWVGYCK